MIAADWKKTLRYAWSVRFLALAGLLSGLEFIWPQLLGFLSVSPAFGSLLSVALIASAFMARLIAQKEFGDGE